ncbi:MAG TPA: hypothetical protein VHX37_13440 [Acidobacteriaceae bacterium]|jgi:hypothetical protein|nr:hypothetical protein [Acidobacteriaceae bacterium]
MFGLTSHQSFLLGLGALWAFSAAVSALDSPDSQSSHFYRWLYKFAKMIAGDLASSVLGKYLPSTTTITQLSGTGEVSSSSVAATIAAAAPRGGGGAALVILAALLLGVALPAHAQTTTTTPPASQTTTYGVENLYAVGVSYNVGATPAVAGTGLYARNLNTGSSLPTYAFTAVDALPNTLKPFTVSTNMGAGIAQQVATIGNVPIYVPTAVGVSWNGTNTGWQWNTGAIASIHLKGNYYLLPSVRIVKSSVTGGTGYQPIIGVLFGWGK